MCELTRCENSRGRPSWPALLLFLAVASAAPPLAAQYSFNIRVDDAATGVPVQGVDLAGSSAGTLHVVWIVDSPAHQIRYQQSTTRGSYWSASEPLFQDAGNFLQDVRIAVDRTGGTYDGSVYVVFTVTQSPDYDIMLLRSADRGITWDPVVHQVDPPNPGPDYVMGTAIAVGGNGVLAATYTRMNNGQEIRAARSADRGATWTDDQRIDDDVSRTDAKPAIASAGSHVYVSYRPLGGPGFAVVHSGDGGATWQPPVQAAASAENGRVASSLAIEPATGRVILVFEMDGNGIGRVYSDDFGRTWSAQARIDDDGTGAFKRTPDTLIEGATVHAFWSDERNGDEDVYHSSSRDRGQTWGDGVPDSDDRVDDTDRNSDPLDDASTQRAPSAAGISGLAAVVWLDDRSGAGSDGVFTNGDLRPVLTEFRNEPPSNQLIELYNPSTSVHDLSFLRLRINDGPELPLSGTVAGLGYATLGPATAFPFPDCSLTLGLSPDSGVIRLVDVLGRLVSEILYGTQGTVPDPWSDASTARHYSPPSAAYTDDWTYEEPSSFGSANTCGARAAAPQVVLNEILFNPVAPQEMYIELFSASPAAVDLTGYRIVTDGVHTIGSVTVAPDYPYYTVHALQDPALFAGLDPAGDNVYLYDASGDLMDMAGWSTLHSPGLSMARAPEGFGAYEGHDDASSTKAGWVFDSDLTVPVISIEANQSLYGDLGENLEFPLTIRNNGLAPDIIDIDIDGVLGTGWPAVVLDENGINPIPDSNHPDGRPDVRLGPGASMNVVLRVDLPPVPPAAPQERFDAVIQSASTLFAVSRVRLQASIYPHVWIDKTVLPPEINIEGAGSGEEATVTLSAHGGGYPVPADVEIDVVFVVDVSASMPADAIQHTRAGLRRIVGGMKSTDRAAVLSFSDAAQLVGNQHLTSDKGVLNSLIDQLAAGTESTALAPALAAGNDELLQFGDPARNRQQLLITTGARDYTAAMDEAHRAADNEFKVHAVGYGPYVSHSLLRDIADTTTSRYIYAADLPGLETAMDDMGLVVFFQWSAARDPDPTDADPLVRDVLPPAVHYVADSATDPASGAPRLPDRAYVDGADQTFLEWEVGAIAVDECWSVSFRITSEQPGLQLANVVDLSRVEYLDWRGQDRTQLFPEAWVTVNAGSAGCPLGFPDRIADLNLARSGFDIVALWGVDTKAEGGYNIYNDAAKANIPLLNHLSFTPVESLVSPPFTLVGAVGAGLRYYQVLGVCGDGITEGGN